MSALMIPAAAERSHDEDDPAAVARKCDVRVVDGDEVDGVEVAVAMEETPVRVPFVPVQDVMPAAEVVADGTGSVRTVPEEPDTVPLRLGTVAPAVPVPEGGGVVEAPAPWAEPVGSVEPPMRIKLNRRGRAVVGLLVVALAAGFVLLVDVLVVRPTQASALLRPERVERHVVMPGETLWEIANQLDPDTDTRDVVELLVDLNDLPDPALTAGQVILVPGR